MLLLYLLMGANSHFWSWNLLEIETVVLLLVILFVIAKLKQNQFLIISSNIPIVLMQKRSSNIWKNIWSIIKNHSNTSLRQCFFLQSHQYSHLQKHYCLLFQLKVWGPSLWTFTDIKYSYKLILRQKL